MSNEYINKLKLHLDKDNGWFFGVCAGLANLLNLDPALIRVGTIVSGLFFPKLTIAAYLVAWLVLDDRPLIRRRSRRD